MANRIFEKTGDEGRAIAGASSVVTKRGKSKKALHKRHSKKHGKRGAKAGRE